MSCTYYEENLAAMTLENKMTTFNKPIFTEFLGIGR